MRGTSSRNMRAGTTTDSRHARAAALAALLTLGSLVAVVPSASACSFAGGPPAPPGEFVLRNLTTGAVVARVPVALPSTGAGCELANPHAFDSERFAWLEQSWNPSRVDLHVHDLAANLTRTWENVSTASIQSLAIGGTHAYWHERVFLDNGSAHARIVSLDLETGVATPLDVALHVHDQVAMHGSTFVIIARDASQQDGEATLSVYDAGTRAWRLAPTPASDMGLERAPWVRHVSPRWALVGSEHVLDLASLDVRTVPRLPEGIIGIDSDFVYVRDGSDAARPGVSLLRRPILGGDLEPAARAPDEALHVTRGVVVGGRISTAPPVAEPTPPWSAREQGWSPRGTGVPDVWLPRDLVQGESAPIMVIEFRSESARIDVTPVDGGDAVFSAELPLTRQGGGRYGELFWDVPHELPPGRYAVRVAGESGEGIVTETTVHEGPRIYASPPNDPEWRLSLEAVGFDARPVSAVFVQGPLRWEAWWPDGRGEPRVVGEPVEANVPGADVPTRALGATDGSQSVVIAPRIVAEPGAPIRAWFNGTFDGQPRAIVFEWVAPPREAGPRVILPRQAYDGDALEVVVYGLYGNVSFSWANATATRASADGFVQAMLGAATAPGEHVLRIEALDAAGAAVTLERVVDVAPRPVVAEEHWPPAGGPTTTTQGGSTGAPPTDAAPVPAPAAALALVAGAAAALAARGARRDLKK